MNRLTTSFSFLISGLLALNLMLSACGGSSVTGGTAPSATNCAAPTAQDQNGCAYLTMTDAPGDFITYTVNIDSLQLKRQDGATVELVPNTTTVDFAQYSNLTEFLSGIAMPPGSYVSGTIVMDFSSANIQVQDSNGNAVQVTPVDQNGNPLTGPTNLTINLDTVSGTLVIAPGIPRLLNVDFNLDASNTVNVNGSGTPTTVTVQPFLDAAVNPNINNLIRVRGPLASVNLTNSSYVIGLRPFRQAMTGSTNPYGQATIYTTSSTVFEINQQTFTGSAGLQALQSAGALTATEALGTYDFSRNQFDATEVNAGSSVPGGSMDAAQGVVTAVSGNTITLRGATIIRSTQTVVFQDSVAVTVGSNTRVREEGQGATTFTTADISVGQRLLVFGTVSGSAPSLSLDATAGAARLLYTAVDSTFIGPDGSGTGMLVNVQSFEGRPVSLFNPAGTGSNYSSYDIALNGLSDSGFTGTDPVRTYGFVTPFGSAPPDFSAKTVADFANANSRLRLSWGTSPTASAFSQISSNGIVFNLGTAPTIQNLWRGGIVVSLSSLSPAPTVVGNGGIGAYAILQNGTVTVHLLFANFVNDLNARLSATAKVQGFYAAGGFASSTSTLTANGIAVILK
jgi:hypothetical protein